MTHFLDIHTTPAPMRAIIDDARAMNIRWQPARLLFRRMCGRADL
jgi:hypothetical protein